MMTCLCNSQRKCLCIYPLAMLLMLRIAKKKYCSLLLEKISLISNQATREKQGVVQDCSWFLSFNPTATSNVPTMSRSRLLFLPLTPTLLVFIHRSHACLCPLHTQTLMESCFHLSGFWFVSVSFSVHFSFFPLEAPGMRRFRCGKSEWRKMELKSICRGDEGTSCPLLRAETVSQCTSWCLLKSYSCAPWLIKSCQY